MSKKKNLNSKDELTTLVVDKGITSFENLIHFVKNIPYGRTKNRYDFSLVLKENKGTCSSKHALLQQIANHNSIPDVKLMLCMFRMNAKNTPQVSSVLKRYNLSFIPEAHCYLKINGLPIDVTNRDSDFNNLKNDLVKELEIQSNQVVDFKVEYHKNFMKQWIKENKLHYTFEDLWNIREMCIASL